MHVALIIGGSLVGVGVVLYIHHRLTGHGAHTIDEEADNTELSKTKEAESSVDPECCGMHLVCEKDSLSPVFGDEIEYFDDEELDAYIGLDPVLYDNEDIERFREVLLTLRPEDIAPWARSIQQRNITLPEAVRDELFILINESRL